MRPSHFPIALAGVALLIACSDSTVAPSSTLTPAPALRAAATTGGMTTITFEGDRYIDCVGQTVHFHGDAPATFQSTVTPSGNVIFADHFIVGAATGWAAGVTSADRWILARLVSPEVIRVTAGSGAFFGSNATWESTTGGPSFTLRQNFHIVQQADGTILVDRFDNVCRAF